jgi:adenosylmethionine---8-amino-7-oxononanoate aminotransferase
MPKLQTVSASTQPTRSDAHADAAITSPDAIRSLQHADRWHHWHGFTQMAEYESLLIERAEGNWLIDITGRRLLDGVSSLWCNVHGHCHPRINAAISDQLAKVAHVTSIGMGCTTTALLAERLAAIAPGDLNHVFFSSDGSSAVEAALKMALQYWHLVGRSDSGNRRPTRTKYLAVGSAYHGDTTGAVSLGDIAHFHRLFDPILFEPLRGPCPDSYRLPDISADQALDYYADQFDRLIQSHCQELAAVVIEPLIQGAAGMVIHPAGLLRRLRDACDQFGVLLIADEVATGLGRTGKMFACQHEQVVPDLMCIGKGLTGGYLPMAATIARQPIFEAFLGARAANQQFFHGHTFSGNPLAAAAALASLEIFESERLLEQLPAKVARIRRGLESLTNHPYVGQVRQLGMMAAVELVSCRQSRQTFPADWEIGHRVCQVALESNVWIRPLGDVIVLMPPLSINDEEIDLLTAAVCQGVERVCCGAMDPAGQGQ